MTGSTGLALSPFYGPVFLYLDCVLTIPFPKPYRKISENLDELEQRGLRIDDREHAEKCLSRIGYYRLSAYWYPFREIATDQEESKRRDQFRAGANFDDVLKFYLFDKSLRLTLNDALERIEIAVRAKLIETLGAIHPCSYRDPRTYTASFTQAHEGQEPLLGPFLDGLDRSFDKSQEEFAKHFRHKYDKPPPVWIAAGTWDWGNLSYMLGYLSEKNRDTICRSIDSRLSRRSLASWMKALNEVRNACAHHSRLWNKALINNPRLNPAEISEFTYLADDCGKVADEYRTRLYGALIVMCFLMRALYPKTEWPQRLGKLILAAELPVEVSQRSAGFPDNWQADPLWFPSGDQW